MFLLLTIISVSIFLLYGMTNRITSKNIRVSHNDLIPVIMGYLSLISFSIVGWLLQDLLLAALFGALLLVPPSAVLLRKVLTKKDFGFLKKHTIRAIVTFILTVVVPLFYFVILDKIQGGGDNDAVWLLFSYVLAAPFILSITALWIIVSTLLEAHRINKMLKKL